MPGKSRLRLAPIMTEPSSWMSDLRALDRTDTRHRTVVIWRSEKTVKNPRQFGGLALIFGPFGRAISLGASEMHTNIDVWTAD